MDFRAPTVAAQQNAQALNYLTKNLRDREGGERQVRLLIEELGNAVDAFPDWHPILTAPPRRGIDHISSPSNLEFYAVLDHTVYFVRGFVTCPYSEEAADRFVESVSKVQELKAYRLETPLYSENACPVVVSARNVVLEADGTIRSRDAITWFVQQEASAAASAQVAETWWNIRSNILGCPHGSRSSLFVNQHAGVHMRKILDAMNNSGMFGPVKESCLDMISQKNRNSIGDNLIRAAINNWDSATPSFEFEMRGEICRAHMRDTWGDNYEISVRVEIGKFDLYVSGFYYPEENRVTHVDPRGKRKLAEKFV